MRFRPVESNLVLSCDGASKIEVLSGTFEAPDGDLSDFMGKFLFDLKLDFIVNMSHLSPVPSPVKALLGQFLVEEHGGLLDQQGSCRLKQGV